MDENDQRNDAAITPKTGEIAPSFSRRIRDWIKSDDFWKALGLTLLGAFIVGSVTVFFFHRDQITDLKFEKDGWSDAKRDLERDKGDADERVSTLEKAALKSDARIQDLERVADQKPINKRYGIAFEFDSFTIVNVTAGEARSVPDDQCTSKLCITVLVRRVNAGRANEGVEVGVIQRLPLDISPFTATTNRAGLMESQRITPEEGCGADIYDGRGRSASVVIHDDSAGSFRVGVAFGPTPFGRNKDITKSTNFHFVRFGGADGCEGLHQTPKR